MKTEADRSLWLNRLGLSEEVSDHDQLCQVLLTKVALRNGDRTEHGLAATFQDRLDWTPARLLGAICRLLPAEELPVVGFTWRDASLEWLPSTAEELFSLASAAPRLPIALLLPPAATRLFLERSHESRAITFLREGLIDLSKTHHGCTQHHVDEEADCDRRTSGVGPSEAVLSDIEKDAARSAAERFLFEVLEATPATTGLFALNVKLDFPFGGSRPAEIDLACRPYKLAIEIDGHYHFLDMESYRRDRRKDVELQRRGWLVMRFLADDVGPRQEEIVAAIVSAVAERRREGQR